MVTKLKDKLLPTDYMIYLFRKLQNLRWKEMNMKEFIEEIYHLLIQLGQVEKGEEAVMGYVNDLKYVNQDELVLSRFKTVR